MRLRTLVATGLVVVVAVGGSAVPAKAGDTGITATQQQDRLFALVRKFRANSNKRKLHTDSSLQREARQHSGELAQGDDNDFNDFSSHVHDIQADHPGISSTEICGIVDRVSGIPTTVADRIFDDWRHDPSARACLLDQDGYKANLEGLSVKFQSSKFYATIIIARS